MKARYIAYCIWLTIALLGVVCAFVPEKGWQIGQLQLRFPTLAEALDMQESTPIIDSTWLADMEDIELPQDTISLPKPEPVDTTPIITPTATVDSTIHKQVASNTSSEKTSTSPDSRQYLAAFYQALKSADQMPVRVIHYGDSQIEEDRITTILREQWQKKYGGGGPGLLPLHQTIPTRTIRQRLSIDGIVQSSQKGPKRYLIYGPRRMRMDTTLYGVMGQVAIMDSTLVKGSEEIVMNVEPIDKMRKPHNYFNRVRVLTSPDLDVSILHPNAQKDLTSTTPYYILPDSTTKCEIHLQGKGQVYGVSLETPTGIIVDNIPMRGCSGTIFTKIDSAQLSDFYRETNTRLIILQFGGNMIPQTDSKSTISGYVRSTLRQQIRHIRACAPQASILFIGPSDMSTNINGTITTYPLVPYMDLQLKKMAAEEKIAYWSIYDAMGGYNSMVSWHDKGLAGSDYVHFTRAGANTIGKKLYKWIDEASEKYVKEESQEVKIDSLEVIVDSLEVKIDSLEVSVDSLVLRDSNNVAPSL